MTTLSNAFFIHNWTAAFGPGFVIFSWWDVVKLLTAATIYFQLCKALTGTQLIFDPPVKQ